MVEFSGTYYFGHYARDIPSETKMCHPIVVLFSDVVKGMQCRQAKDADGKFCLGNRCQRLPSANHVCV